MKGNLRTMFEVVAEPESIQTAVIGPHHSGEEPIPAACRGVVLVWAEAAPLLDYDYDRGYGGADCHPVYAWTATRVLFVHEYDGATSVSAVPCSPVPCVPDFDGSPG